MRNTKYHINTSKLHFKRWSNTSFAVFCSIGKEVVIGVVSSILDKLVTVKSSVLGCLLGVSLDKSIIAGEETEELEQSKEGGLLKEILNSLILIQRSPISIPVSGITKFTYYKISHKAYFGPFLLPSVLKDLINIFQISQIN